MTTETTTRICEHLEKYVFDKIWNDPYSEYRTFIRPESLSNVATAGVFFGRYDKIQLPSEVSYRDKRSKLFFYLYSVPAAYFRSLKVNATDWVALDDLGSNGILDFEFFNSNGKRCLRAGVFLKQSSTGDCIYVAVETSAFSTCFGSDLNPDGSFKDKESDVEIQFFLGKYLDSDLEASVKYESFRLKATDLPSSGAKPASYDPITASGDATYVLYNGSLLTDGYQGKLISNSLVEKVTDGNIIGSFDVPVQLENAYQPQGSWKTKLLVHIPKSINKDSAIITPNTCDIYLVPTKMKDGGSPCFSSIYLYQCGRGDYFTQLTHNDFAIDYQWIRLLMSLNEFEECVVRVFVRKPIKDKYAIRDAHYLNLLYTHDDEEIVAFLLNKGIYDIPFWTASSLENGLYGLATLKRRDLNRHYTINEFVALLGYYHTLALIGKRVTHFEVLSESTGTREFVVNAPLGLRDFKAEDFFPLVYVNGIRIDQTNIEVRSGINIANMHNKELTFTPDASWWTRVVDNAYSTKLRVIVNGIPLKVGDKVVVELLDNQVGSRQHCLTVTSGLTETMQTDKFSVYIVHDEVDHNNVAYEKVDGPGEFDAETNTLTFDDSLVGQKVIVIDGSMTLEDQCHVDISHSSIYHLGKSLWSDPISQVDNFPRDSEIVFLNDRSLIRGLDYTMEGYRLLNRRNGAKVFVQNVNYLRPENGIAVIRTDQRTLSHQRGYLTGNIVTWNHQNPFWFDELSIMSIGGRVCSNLIHEFGTITITDSHDNGVPYEYRMSVSSRIAELLDGTDKEEDDSRLMVIQAYFASRYKFPDHISIVKHPHRIYSLYLEQIISDFLTTDFDWKSLPSQELFEEQFAAYSEWKARDLAFNMSEHDLLYVDISPTYNTLQISNGFHYQKLSELIRRLMPKDAHRYKDTRNVK